MTKTRAFILAAAATAFAALSFYSGTFYSSRPARLSGASAPAGTPGFAAAADHKVWMCPMHPEILQDHPGTCPICGMKLVEGSGGAAHQHGVMVDSATVQRLGIRLARVRQGVIGQDIQAYGNVVASENSVSTVHTRYDGWIKKLHVHAVGDRVAEGQVLYEIYSPDLIARERTYLSSIERRKQLLQTIPTTAATENEYVMDLTVDAASDRARLHSEEGVALETIQEIEDAKQAADVVKIAAGSSGVVSQINVREGTYVMASTPLLTLSGVARVWVDVPLYPDQVGMVKAGDPVTIQLPNAPAIRARLDFVSPLAENNKVHARVYLDNGKLRLRPGTLADVSISAQPHPALVLPRSAILYTARGSMVMLARGDGRFLPTPVETGNESGDAVEIVSGLREGAEVAVNGQFLLDSASSMNAAAERMQTQQP